MNLLWCFFPAFDDSSHFFLLSFYAVNPTVCIHWCQLNAGDVYLGVFSFAILQWVFFSQRFCVENLFFQHHQFHAAGSIYTYCFIPFKFGWIYYSIFFILGKTLGNDFFGGRQAQECAQSHLAYFLALFCIHIAEDEISTLKRERETIVDSTTMK